MNIDPCPYCGSSDENIGRTSESVAMFWVHCRACCCDGPAKETLEQAIDAHNRLSRIVRAAEAWAKARRTGSMLEISEAGNALLDAVEGGAE